MPRVVGTQYSADDLLQMSDNVTAMQVILSGVINKELTDLKALKSEIKEKQGITDTVEKANRIKTEAENYASKVKGDADSLMAKSLDAQKIAKERLDQAISKENYITTDLVAREKQLQQDLQGLKSRETALQVKADQMNQSMLARENLLREEQTKLSAEREVFQNERSTYQAKVQALMTP
jgi:hypothetical protein